MKIALICSQGGHLTEMLCLMDAFKRQDLFFITYKNPTTDQLDYRRYLVENIGTSFLKMVKTLFQTFSILKKEKPDLIVSTGAEIAIPFYITAKLMRIDTIYIDSAAQQLKADLAYDYDIYCENAIKSVNDGIAAVQVLIENDNLFVDVNKCGHTYSSLSSYKWNPKTENPKPVHDWASHASDAVRYAIYTHQKRSVGIFAAA